MEMDLPTAVQLLAGMSFLVGALACLKALGRPWTYAGILGFILGAASTFLASILRRPGTVTFAWVGLAAIVLLLVALTFLRRSGQWPSQERPTPVVSPTLRIAAGLLQLAAGLIAIGLATGLLAPEATIG